MFSHFIYDGVPSDYYDVIACWVESNLDGVEPAGMQTDTATQFAKRGSVFNIVQQSYNKPIEFKIQLINKDATHIDVNKERELKKWLCKRGEYRWMQILRDDYEDLWVLANFSNPKYIYYGGICGLEFQVITSSPHMFSPPIKKKFNITSDNRTVNLYIENDEDDYVYPNVKIKMNQSGALTIRNSTEVEHRDFRVENTKVGEEIYIDSSLPDISAIMPAAYSGEAYTGEDGIALANEGIACCNGVDNPVVVASDDDIATVALTYKKTYLYKRGDECTSVTGGWSKDERSPNYPVTTLTKKDKYIEMNIEGTTTLYSSADVSLVTNKGVLNGYKRVCVKYTATTESAYRVPRITLTGRYEANANANSAVITADTEVDLTAEEKVFTVVLPDRASTHQYLQMAFRIFYDIDGGYSYSAGGNLYTYKSTTIRVHEVWLETDELVEDDSSSGSESDNKVYLYDYGNECTSITGGWSAKSTTTGSNLTYNVSKQNSHMYFYATSPSTTGDLVNGGFCTNNKIDLSGYTKFCVRYKIDTDISGGCGWYGTTVNTSYLTESNVSNGHFFEWLDGHGTVTDEIILDNSLKSTEHVYFKVLSGASGKTSFLYIYQVWLEKETSGGDSGGSSSGSGGSSSGGSDSEDSGSTTNKTYLYDYGVTSDIAGGWTLYNDSNTNATVRENSNHLYFNIKYDSNSHHIRMTTNKSIDFSSYNKICFKYSYAGVSNVNATIYDGAVPIEIGTQKTVDYTGSTNYFRSFYVNANEENSIYSKPVGSATGSGHLYISLNTWFTSDLNTNKDMTLKIHQIWLEKEESSDGSDTPPNVGTDDAYTTYLYNYGKTSPLVGSWYLYDSEDDGYYTGTSATIKENSNHLYFNIVKNNDNVSQTLCAITNKMLDLSPYEKIGIKYDYEGVANTSYVGTAPITFATKTEKNAYASINGFPFHVSSKETGATQYMDLMNYHKNENKYFSIMLSENNSTSSIISPVTGNMTFRIYQIWLEKKKPSSGGSGDSGGSGGGNTEDFPLDENGRKLLYNYGVTSPLVGSWSTHKKNSDAIVEERDDHLYFHTNYDSGKFVDTYACMITSKKLNLSPYAKVGIRYDYNGVSNIAYTGVQPIVIATKTENSPTNAGDIMPFFAYGDEANKIQRTTLYGHESGTKHLSFMIKTDKTTQPVTNMPLTLKIYQIWVEIPKEESEEDDDTGSSGGSSGGSGGVDWDEPFVPINAYPNIYHEFNKNWIRFVDGRNTLTFNLNCEIEFEYREIRKVGILS